MRRMPGCASRPYTAHMTSPDPHTLIHSRFSKGWRKFKVNYQLRRSWDSLWFITSTFSIQGNNKQEQTHAARCSFLLTSSLLIFIFFVNNFVSWWSGSAVSHRELINSNKYLVKSAQAFGENQTFICVKCWVCEDNNCICFPLGISVIKIFNERNLPLVNIVLFRNKKWRWCSIPALLKEWIRSRNKSAWSPGENVGNLGF